MLEVRDGAGRVLVLKSRKTRALLALLALRAPRMIMRSEITSLLWSRRDVQQARGSLRQALHELHTALGPEGQQLLIVTRSHIGLRWSSVRADTVLLTDESANRDALDLYQPTLLADLAGIDPAFDRLLETETERLARAALALAERLLDETSSGGEGVAVAERLLAIDPTHEGAWRTIIRAHAQRGDRAAATAAFERCRVRLAAKGGLAPSAETTALIESIRGPQTLPARPDVPAYERSRPDWRIRVGVMPLRSLDPDQDDGLCLGLAEEITTALAPFRWISCVSSTSLGAIAGESRETSHAWRALDLDFLLEGTIQTRGGRHRILTRLLDMRAGGEIAWARRFDLPVSDLLEAQNQIASATAAQIAPELMLREGEHAARRRKADPTAHDLMLRAIPAIYRLDPAGFRAAGEMLEQALQLDPQNAAAHAWFAHWHIFHIGQGWADDPEAARHRAVELAERAVMLDPGDARALTLAGHIRGFLAGRPREGQALHERALAINPNLALAWCMSGLSHVYLGEHEQAIRHIRQAQFLSPHDPHGFFFDMALTMPHVLREEYEIAAELGRRAVELNPIFSSSYKPYLAALGHLGRAPDAKVLVARLLSLEPRFCVQAALERSPLTRPDDLLHYAEGLRRAGVPETPA